jgi:hypothetical protein
VETAGNRNLQTRTYKQEIQLYKLLESDKQVVRPVSTQASLEEYPLCEAVTKQRMREHIEERKHFENGTVIFRSLRIEKNATISCSLNNNHPSCVEAGYNTSTVVPVSRKRR